MDQMLVMKPNKLSVNGEKMFLTLRLLFRVSSGACLLYLVFFILCIVGLAGGPGWGVIALVL